MTDYQPSYTITPDILNLVAAISETVGRLTVLTDQAGTLRLRRASRIRIIHGSLAIEGNTLTEAQITAVLNGKRVIAPPRWKCTTPWPPTSISRAGSPSRNRICWRRIEF